MTHPLAKHQAKTETERSGDSTYVQCADCQIGAHNSRAHKQNYRHLYARQRRPMQRTEPEKIAGATFGH